MPQTSEEVLVDAVAAFVHDKTLVKTKKIVADYTLDPSDHGWVLEVDSVTPVAITVPPDLTAAEPTGKAFLHGHVTGITAIGTGTVTIAPILAKWVEVKSWENMKKLAGPNASASIRHRDDVNRWFLDGRLKLA